MVEKQLIMVAKRVAGGDWLRFMRDEDRPFSWHLSGGLREREGQSRLLSGQQEVSLQVFPGEQVELTEEVQA